MGTPRTNRSGVASNAFRKATDAEFLDVLKLLTHGDHCSPDVLRELCRTPTMRQRMMKVGFLPSRRKDDTSRGSQPDPGRGARQVLSKLGIPLPKEPAKNPGIAAHISVGRPDRNRTTLRLTREMLYERVWAEPVEKLAKSWGLSGRGLAKACKRAGVSVPPRGYWARAQNGQRPRRTPLREVEKGYPVEIVVNLPLKKP